MKRHFLLAGIGAVAVLAAACDSGPTGYGAAAPPSAAASAPAGPTAPASLATAGSGLGTILTDGQGRTVYLLDSDPSGRSTCAADCAAVWPPVTSTEPLAAGAGLVQAMLGSSTRSDGSTQLTYGGHPLYYFVHDSGPGTTAGQGITTFGGTWFVLDPAGNKIDRPAATGY